MRISDWSSEVCSSDLRAPASAAASPRAAARADRPDRDQRIAVDDMDMVVEIDRRVAVRDGQRHRVAGGERVADAGRDQRSMFVAHEGKEGAFALGKGS